MALINCKICGKVFDSLTGKKTCPNCVASDEKEYEIVRTYVKDNPKAPINEVAEQTAVSIDKISEYLRTGLLERAEIGEIMFKCQLCGAEIVSGNYCMACMEKLKKGLKSKKINKSEQEKSGIRSFILNFNKKK